MEGKEIRTAVGVISSDNIMFGEILVDMLLGIKSVPADIRNKINRAMESDKRKQSQRIAWNNRSADSEVWLHICIDNNGFSSWIGANIMDRENETWAGTSVDVDLSGDMGQLKPFLIKAVIGKLFG